METKIKNMNKEQRFAHCMMLLRTYTHLMTMDAIFYESSASYESWRKEARIAWNILHNMSVMRGEEIYLNLVLR